MREGKEEENSPTREAPTSDDAVAAGAEMSPTMRTSMSVPGYAGMILNLTDDDGDDNAEESAVVVATLAAEEEEEAKEEVQGDCDSGWVASAAHARLEAGNQDTATDLSRQQTQTISNLQGSGSTYNKQGEKVGKAWDKKMATTLKPTSNLKSTKGASETTKIQQHHLHGKNTTPGTCTTARKSDSLVGEEEKEQISGIIKPRRFRNRKNSKKESGVAKADGLLGKEVASLESRSDINGNEAFENMQRLETADQSHQEQPMGVKRPWTIPDNTRQEEQIPDSVTESVDLTTISRSGGDGVDLSRPGAFAAAPSIMVPRETPDLHTLNEQMTASSHSAEITLGTISADGLVSLDEESLFSEDENEEMAGETIQPPTEVVEAFRVEDDDQNNSEHSNSITRVADTEDLEGSLRRQIIREAVSARVVTKIWRGRLFVFAGIFLLALVVALTATLVYRSANSPESVVSMSDNDPTQPPNPNVPILPNNTTNTTDTNPTSSPTTGEGLTASTLQNVLDRQLLRCGAYGTLEDFDTSSIIFETMCRAIAAAIFGRDGAGKYEMVIVYPSSRFFDLQMGNIDVLAQMATHTMGRDMSEILTGQGFTFSHPFFYAGIVFSGVPVYKECAEQFDSFNGICRGLKICIGTGMTNEPLLNELLPGATTISVDNPIVALGLLNSGMCNVIVTELVTLRTAGLEAIGLSTDLNFTIGTKSFATDPGDLVTMDGSVELSDIVNSVVKILYTAEAMNLTKGNVDTYPFSADLDPRLKDRMIDVVSTVGNYGDVFALGKSAGVINRNGMNALNLLNTTATSAGLMYPYPFGRVERYPPETAQSETMEKIELLGRLRCGIIDKPLNFARYVETLDEYFGFDVEYCRALSAALFVGDTTQVDVVMFMDESHAFTSLANGSVDVVAGQRVTLTNEFFEPTTRKSYAFSMPTYYGDDGSIWALATLRSDGFWSSFVFWVTMALVHAEEQDITLSNAAEMPAVNLFGDMYIQAFRDCVGAFGNYGDIYERTLEAVLPRSGRNQLNRSPHGSQQVGYPLL